MRNLRMILSLKPKAKAYLISVFTNLAFNIMVYKGYIIEGDWFVKESSVNFKYKADPSGRWLVEDKESNRKTVEMDYFDGNGTIMEAIDLMESLKGLQEPPATTTALLDHWFNDLGKDVHEYKKVIDSYRFDKLFNNRFSDFETFTDLLNEYAVNSPDFKAFLTPEKIRELFDAQYIRLRIQLAKQENIARLSMV